MFSNGSLTEEQSSTTAGLLYVLNDIARVSKRCEDASPVIRAKLEGKYKFSKDAVEELGKVIDNVEIMYRTSIVSLEMGIQRLQGRSSIIARNCVIWRRNSTRTT